MKEPDDEQIQEIEKRVGTVLLWIGAVISLLMFIDRSGLYIMSLPAFWYRSRSLHLLICIGFFFFGMFLLRNRTVARNLDGGERNKTADKRPLFESVRFYSRGDCPLCSEAMEMLEEYGDWMPEIEFIDIAGDPLLEAQHAAWIPVIEIDGRIRFRGRVDAALMQRLIAAQQRRHHAGEQEESS